MQRFNDKVVLVTGGSSGIGLAAATALANEGASVIVTGRDPAALESARSRIGSSARSLVSDATRQSDIAALADNIASTEGRLDAVFINAGSAAPAPFEAIQGDNLDAMIDVHVKGPSSCSSRWRR